LIRLIDIFVLLDGVYTKFDADEDVKERLNPTAKHGTLISIFLLRPDVA